MDLLSPSRPPYTLHLYGKYCRYQQPPSHTEASSAGQQFQYLAASNLIDKIPTISSAPFCPGPPIINCPSPLTCLALRCLKHNLSPTPQLDVFLALSIQLSCLCVSLILMFNTRLSFKNSFLPMALCKAS